ncbi:hypothetical protein DEU34_2249 [Microbacterium sp. AG1240]|nr:hypothetical protein [Microbacterium sp. AG1240]RKT33646.1 hypothetical protein DEU34_2249 [Microbacterium sp. AG1240]
MTTIVFTLPDEYAERMRKNSGEFYLDVFGRVRDRESTDAIGHWQEMP